MNATNYSFETSLKPYRENPSGKQRQKEIILQAVAKGANNLRQLELITGLPQSTVAGRIGDLLVDGKVRYHGFVEFGGRKRKRIVLCSPLEVVQTKLF